MMYLKKRYYRIFESLIKKVLQIQKKSKNENFQKMIRSATFNSETGKNNFLYTNGKDVKYIMQSSDWVSKKLYIDQSFDDKIFKKTIKILKIKKYKKTKLNVGAHIGSTCIPALKKKYFKDMIAFEPSKINFNLLAVNVYINNLGDRAQIFNLAISNKKSKTYIKKFQNTGDYRVVNSKNKNLELIKCDILDNYTKKLNKKNSLIFMDTQGHEPLVFLGSKKTLNKKIPIVFEFAPFLMDNNWIKGFHLIFKNYKYFYDLHNSSKRKKLNKEEIIRLYKKLNSTKQEADTDLLIS